MPTQRLLHEPSQQLCSLQPKLEKPACVSGRGWGDRFGSIHELRRYSVVKEKGLPVNATMWLNLRSSMLSKRRQTLKNTHCVNIYTEVKEGEWFPLARRSWLGRGVRELSGWSNVPHLFWEVIKGLCTIVKTHQTTKSCTCYCMYLHAC